MDKHRLFAAGADGVPGGGERLPLSAESLPQLEGEPLAVVERITQCLHRGLAISGIDLGRLRQLDPAPEEADERITLGIGEAAGRLIDQGDHPRRLRLAARAPRKLHDLSGCGPAVPQDAVHLVDPAPYL